MTKKIVITILLGALSNLSKAQIFTLTSPSGKVQVSIENKTNLSYSIHMNGKVILTDSPMGFKFKNEPDMGAGLLLIDQKKQKVNDQWIPVVKSKHALILDHYKTLQLSFIEKTGLMRKMDVEFRAYDDGVAFRYQLYRSQNVGNRHLKQELTGFNLAGDPKAWVADYKSYTTSQEKPFLPKKLSTLTDSTLAGLPFLIEIDKSHYAAITEAKIDNYPGFYIGLAKNNNTGHTNLVTRLSPLPLEADSGDKVRFSDKIFTPWRVVMLAESPGKLIESEIIQNLNDPCVLKDVSFIKPGMSAWDHWWSGDVKQDMPSIKQYIDLASTQGWQYMIMDWQWYGDFDVSQANILKAAPQLNMPEILAYAKQKNIRIWLWLTNGDANRNNNFEEAFALYEKWGIAGVKIDFMNRDDQEMVNWYHEIIKLAAEHHLMVDFHSAYKPDGIIRTYPNLITREGVMGEEHSKIDYDLIPEHNVTLPFTRMLAGQMDYTPGGFVNVTKKQFKLGQLPTQVMNTRCAELSKFVIYESPFMVYCDHPDNILGKPGADFLQHFPTVWDDIHVLSGYPGEYISMVKRTGQRYFVGAMTNSEARTIKIKLDFLPKGKFKMISWADADDANTIPSNLVKSERVVSAGSEINIKMAIGGGFVAEFEALK